MKGGEGRTRADAAVRKWTDLGIGARSELGRRLAASCCCLTCVFPRPLPAPLCPALRCTVASAARWRTGCITCCGTESRCTSRG